ncbi:hypothetical protein SYNPCC7002_A2259 [Picosynechococcus sp. PCC 7002]|nr:hypothetical protein SYNPCC7002_A2259 [Picosynechococcus sp. PCC 7002]
MLDYNSRSSVGFLLGKILSDDYRFIAAIANPQTTNSTMR